MEANDIRRRVAELGPWYQNIDLGDGISTKNLDGDADIFAGHDIPGPLWREIAKDLGDLTGHNVLDIGCNAGYMSFEAKRLNAARVLGIDSNLGATTSFLDQAEFCREVLGLDVEFREQSFFDLPPEPFHTIIFCGVLYHLENWATGLDKLLELAAPGARIVLETASEPITRTTYGGDGYNGDTTTFFVPSMGVLQALVHERGLHVDIARDLGTRALLHLRAPGA